MRKFRIVGARPKGTTNHLNSQFHTYELLEIDKKLTWSSIGWKTIFEVSDFLKAGHEVKTAQITDKKIAHGAAVEIEMRIAHNLTDYKISGMPDK